MMPGHTSFGTQHPPAAGHWLGISELRAKMSLVPADAGKFLCLCYGIDHQQGNPTAPRLVLNNDVHAMQKLHAQ